MAETTPADVPHELLMAALGVVRDIGRETEWGTDGTRVPAEEEQRRVLAAVLPLHERRVRAGIVAELQAHVADCEAHDLPEEARYMAAAARYIHSNPEGNDQDDDQEVAGA